MSEVIFRNPPACRPWRRWADVAAKVKTRPGEWADVGIGSRALKSKLESGQVTGVDPTEFDFVARAVDDEPCRIYMRYVGRPTPTNPVGEDLIGQLAEITAELVQLLAQLTEGAPR